MRADVASEDDPESGPAPWTVVRMQSPGGEPATSTFGDPQRRNDSIVGGLSSAQLHVFTAVWRTTTPRALRFMRAALGVRAGRLDWAEYRSWALRNGLVEPDGESTLKVVDPPVAWTPSMREAARLLLDHWAREPEQCLAGDAVWWAIRLGAWADLGDLWLSQLHMDGMWRRPEVAELLATLPAEARQDSPYLTVARAQSRAIGAHGPGAERQVIREILADAAAFHIQWRQTSRIDAVLAGATLCMVTQRAVPGIDPGSALALAWDVQQEAAMTIERRRAQGSGPSARAESVFRSALAHNALSRGDVERAVIEADHAALLDPEVSLRTADGVGALARELAGSPHEPLPAAAATLDPNYGPGSGLAAGSAIAGILANALGALRELDKVGFEDAIAALADRAPGGALWTVELFLQGLAAALWDDPAQALARFDDLRATHMLRSVEQLEPLGGDLLLRARVALLDRLGASAAARTAAVDLAGDVVPLLEARSLLWSGDHEAARRAANRGLFDSRTPHGDRLALRALCAGAVVLDPTSTETARVEAVRDAFAACLDCRTLLPIAMLPGDLRAEMLAIYLASGGQAAGLADESELLGRLPAVVSTSGVATTPVPLTRREQLLLPLLATAEAVPEIASSLHVSTNTVRTQVANLRRKFGARNRAELVRLARNAGLL